MYFFVKFKNNKKDQAPVFVIETFWILWNQMCFFFIVYLNHRYILEEIKKENFQCVGGISKYSMISVVCWIMIYQWNHEHTSHYTITLTISPPMLTKSLLLKQYYILLKKELSELQIINITTFQIVASWKSGICSILSSLHYFF